MKYVFYPEGDGRADILGIVGPSGTKYDFKVGEYTEVTEEKDINRLMATFGIFEFLHTKPEVKEEEPYVEKVQEVEEKEEPKEEKKKEDKKPARKGLLSKL